ncbi:MAG TPA: outer membrane protein transport protein, partial [Draconibacterium sp.]|nr:outer membrane protein transport protein [Draconibacterium sp.]
IGYNRLKSFNTTSLVGGDNANGSFLDYIASYANKEGFVPGSSNNPLMSNYYEQLAWDADLLLKDQNNVYWHDMEDAGYGQSQQKSISKQGSLDEYSLALGVNFNHKLYLGASVGIMDLYYKESSDLKEWDANNNIPYFNSFTFSKYLRTSGTGYNVKLGVIFKPTNEIRLGASVHTPTFYNLRDRFDTEMQSSLTYQDGSQTYDKVPDKILEYDYDLETPLRATLSGAFVIAKKGLLSVDYEFVNYGSARLRRGGNAYNFASENQDIAKAYRSVGNLRVGGELRVTDAVSLRAGYELYPSAYNSQAFGATQPNADANMNIYSAGLGYHQGNFYFDLAYRYSDLTNYDALYPAPVYNQDHSYPQPQMAAFNTTKNKVLFTFGFRF